MVGLWRAFTIESRCPKDSGQVATNRPPGRSTGAISRKVSSRSCTCSNSSLQGVVPGAQNRALSVIFLDETENVDNAFLERGFLKARTRSQPSQPAEKSAPLKYVLPESDTLYIELADRVSSNSEAISHNLMVDFDELVKLVGVTLEHYSQISDSRHTPMPIFSTGGRRFPWLWGLILALSAVKAASTLWLPTSAPLHQPFCRLMPGLPSCLDGR